MRRSGVVPTLLAFILMIVVVIGSLAFLTVQTGAGTTTSNQPPIQSTTSSAPPAGGNLTVPSANGLELMVSTNATVVPADDSLQVSLSEFNTLTAPNNVSVAHDWPTEVALGSCENIYVQPFGIAVYSGHIDAQNLSQGERVNIFPPTACPEYIRLVTGYDFQPQSDLAVVLPGSQATPSPLVGNVLISTSSSPQEWSLPPGSYTIVAADEWGSLTFVYFAVV